MKEKDVITIEEMRELLKVQRKRDCEICNIDDDKKIKDFDLKKIHKDFCKDCGKKLFVKKFEEEKRSSNKQDVRIITSLLLTVILNDVTFKGCNNLNFFYNIINRHIDFFLSDKTFNLLKVKDKKIIKDYLGYELIPIVTQRE